MKILLLNTQVAPFQVELAQAMNAVPGVSFTIGFTHPSTRARHWDMTAAASCCHVAPDGHAMCSRLGSGS